MTNFIEQFKNLSIAKFEIVLQAQTEAVLPALIGSTLRGAFGHALKAISCSVQHRNCEKCFLSEACLYPGIFEPTSSSKVKDIPRPFIFEPPIPPITREISENQTLKLRVAGKGKISFGLTLLGEAINKLPYFIYALELMARHGLGADRQSFSIFEVLQVDANKNNTSIYTPNMPRILPIKNTTLADFTETRLAEIDSSKTLSIKLLTPLRIRRNKELLENITFAEFFMQCSLRLKFLSENYGKKLEYDYHILREQSEKVVIKKDNLWRHDFTRRTNRQNKALDLDGMLGEIEFQGDSISDFLPFIVSAELLHIGSASSLGLGKFSIT